MERIFEVHHQGERPSGCGGRSPTPRCGANIISARSVPPDLDARLPATGDQRMRSSKAKSRSIRRAGSCRTFALCGART